MYACQRDSYLKEFETKIVALSENEPYLKVELEDTILFPEGGGQNYDTGFIGSHRVVNVFREGRKAIHYVEVSSKENDAPLVPNDLVRLKVDWDRRFDNMQQHTGQHLLSAVLETKLGLKTKSWWMAENSIEEVGQSYIELELMDGHKVPTNSDIQVVEQEANQYIRDQLPVSITTHKLGDPELEKAYSRGLPEDLPKDALIRIVNILEDRNMCCGTHVQNLAHLQIIKTLQFQKSKKTTEFVLYFIVGKRVERYIDICFNRELQLTNLLKNRPLDHYSLIEKALTSCKNTKKINSNLLKELALFEAEKVKNMDPLPKYIIDHRKEGSSEYIGTFIKELTSDKGLNLFIFLIVGNGESGNPYQLALFGDPQDIKKLGSKICEYLDGKGGGSGNRFNAKINSLKEYKKAVALVEEHFK
ncbi:alanyl-tRNA editing protein Aarsd1-B [Lepeophtheirus salmonis]|uniref:Alanyl-tRNA synthetase domain-containing protein 1-B n=1 Tax=Lepeophtheirus salmonis TaxID=72036 RepID=C1BTB9_LEPSM|nr:alanyl-tRNA editing protein Aarsd1-B-like [Lepeophtheirus salmonis]ACO12272.1 Alanyl-tRNA synthetase domain-containing protein 1-B [Lepeophtheirus salmonis]